ncbi:MAG: TetR/AcrR family transcriptional regulator [Desulfobacteraceae bacterium]|nr:MAG: TetR/AcrR family transcriptional regulator [Desulfobacteraceae bacterium]
MVQILKEEIKKRIDRAALKVFSEKGFRDTTMIMVAESAGVSVGNLYHYYKNKKDLFRCLISPDFVREFKNLIDAKMHTADGVSLENARGLPLMNIRDAALREYLAKNRLKIIVLLDKNSHTQYSHFGEILVERIMNNVYKYLESVQPDKAIKLNPEKQELLKWIYSNFLQAIMNILKKYDRAEDIAVAYELLLDYHIGGISKLLG